MSRQSSMTQAVQANEKLGLELDAAGLQKLADYIYGGGRGYVHYTHFNITPQGNVCPCGREACRMVQELEPRLPAKYRKTLLAVQANVQLR